MRFLVSALTFALCLSGLASAQNIYDGCGVDKECLGYEPDNPAENACLEAQVCSKFWPFISPTLPSKAPSTYILTGIHCTVRLIPV